MFKAQISRNFSSKKVLYSKLQIGQLNIKSSHSNHKSVAFSTYNYDIFGILNLINSKSLHQVQKIKNNRTEISCVFELHITSASEVGYTREYIQTGRITLKLRFEVPLIALWCYLFSHYSRRRLTYTAYQMDRPRF